VELAIETSFWPSVHGVPSGALANQLQHFLRCVRTGEPPTITLDDAIEALRLSLAMEASATEGRPIDVRKGGAAHAA
jgi:predicted dehydrogenase